MRSQIAILSQDSVFSRTLELEFLLYGLSVQLPIHATDAFEAEVVLLDLDTMSVPLNGSYEKMIGYTKSSARFAGDAGRRCIMILHRPFEMRVLRREVFEILQRNDPASEAHCRTAEPSMIPPQDRTAYLTLTEKTLRCGTSEVLLSPKEAKIMEILLADRGSVVSRETISAAIGESSANKTDVYICYLRRKLEKGFGNRLIGTVRGKGYRL